ncbi:unnamed protein product [Pleuronectes platessa]|uniref:Uncharacterized protein n=1 Tax=Pleuronectes platessa TaxID=8262 RepID=A0A9N7YY75_PLEPL|nr:unnamed protein product [Pleuronectes platessa]
MEPNRKRVDSTVRVLLGYAAYNANRTTHSDPESVGVNFRKSNLELAVGENDEDLMVLLQTKRVLCTECMLNRFGSSALIEVGTEIIFNSGDSKGPSHEKVINLQTPAVAVETQILKADPSSHGDSNTDSVNSQVINLQTPAVAVETQILKADPSSHGDSNTDSANSQVINLQTPAVEVETGKQSSIS